MEVYLKIAGWLCILLALSHAGFPRYFGWNRQLAQLTLVNRQMIYVHTFFIALTMSLMGLLCLAVPGPLMGTVLGRRISAGLCFFWLVRLAFQLFVYSPKLWRGKWFETAVHVLLTMIWVYFTGVFFCVAFLAGAGTAQ